MGTKVRQIFAEVTRYPLEVLDPGSALEEDLGIDSVKLGEVFAVLREQYSLPEKLDLPRERLKTIGGIADVLHEYLSTREPGHEQQNGNSKNVPLAIDGLEVQAQVRQTFAEVTRYPLDILDRSEKNTSELQSRL